MASDVSASRTNLLSDSTMGEPGIHPFPRSSAAFKAEAHGLQGWVGPMVGRGCVDVCLPARVFSALLHFLGICSDPISNALKVIFGKNILF